MIDSVLSGIIIGAMAFFLGTMFGYGVAVDGRDKDCRALQQFRSQQTVFDCKERSK